MMILQRLNVQLISCLHRSMARRTVSSGRVRSEVQKCSGDRRTGVRPQRRRSLGCFGRYQRASIPNSTSRQRGLFKHVYCNKRIYFVCACPNFCLLWFKHNSFVNSNKKVPIPSHYFIVATYCNNSRTSVDDCVNQTQILSFVLPHEQSSINCWVSDVH